MSHTVYRDRADVPANAKVLGIWVRVPRFLFATDDGVQDDLTISEMQMVYVEISEEEWQRVYGDQGAINALGIALGPEVAAALGGHVKRWDSGPGTNPQ